MITSVGLIAGESTAKPLYQLSGGLVFGRWFAGVGGGYDQYKFNTFPVFVDGRVSFGKKKPGFLYAHIGYNFPSTGLKSREIWGFTIEDDRFDGGIYMDAGVGYRINLGRQHRLLFSVGYSRKHLGNTVEYVYTRACFPEPCDPTVYEYEYKLGRILMKLSWAFGRW